MFLHVAAMSPGCLDVVALPVVASSPQRRRRPLALINAAIFFTLIALLLEENAGRSATTRCPQGVISSGCVPNHLAGVAVDTAEPPKSIDGEALPANASLSPSSSAARRRRPLPGRQCASCRYPEVVNISSTSRDGFRRTPVVGTCHDAPLAGQGCPTKTLLIRR